MSKKQDGKETAEDAVRNIKRQTRRKFNAEEKIRIVLTGLRGEESIAELCRREALLPLGSHSLSHLKSAWAGDESGMDCDESSRQVPESDHSTQSALADGFYLSQSDGMGLVLLQTAKKCHPP